MGTRAAWLVSNLRPPATGTDWRPRLEWAAVEGCPCGGFLVHRPRHGASPSTSHLSVRRQSFSPA